MGLGFSLGLGLGFGLGLVLVLGLTFVFGLVFDLGFVDCSLHKMKLRTYTSCNNQAIMRDCLESNSSMHLHVEYSEILKKD